MAGDDDDVEMALALDYIQNASVGDLSMISSLATIEPTDMYLEGDSGDEAGLFEDLMLGVDRWVESGSSEDDDDDDDALQILDNLQLDSDEDEERAEEQYLKADFEGGPSAWKAGARADESERRFQRTRKAEFAPKPIPHDSDLGSDLDGLSASELALPLSRTQLRKAAKRNRNAQLTTRAVVAANRKAEGQGLAESLAKAGPRITRQVTEFLHNVNDDMRQLAEPPRQGRRQMNEIPLAPMPGAVRRLVCSLAKHYKILPKTRGKGKAKTVVLIRTQRSATPPGWKSLVQQIVTESGGLFEGNTRAAASFTRDRRVLPKKPGPPDQSAKPRTGDIVGHGSSAIGESNIGHRMLKMMGWQPGQSLGADGTGIVAPVEVLVRERRSGLGNVL
ncbi:hypothetical protein HKX48_008239 [Thoreauomyces humboldtii]|nr:hypothetical protein HKX48_008239 [Thoreauomyces humboldtii]